MQRRRRQEIYNALPRRKPYNFGQFRIRRQRSSRLGLSGVHPVVDGACVLFVGGTDESPVLNAGVVFVRLFSQFDYAINLIF